MLESLFGERVCPICKKKMVRVYWGDYAYKIGNKVFCSYKCMRKYEKDQETLNPLREVNRPTQGFKGGRNK
jgi:hypothetical protein